jgi:hypothetical protein
MRYLDVTMMPDMTSATMFTNVDPTNQPAVVTNALINFGWEYVWHCHLLGHEENDMMRPMILAVSPNAPAQFAAVADKGSVTLTWTNNANNQTGFTVQRASSASGPWSNIASVTAVVGVGGRERELRRSKCHIRYYVLLQSDGKQRGRLHHELCSTRSRLSACIGGFGANQRSLRQAVTNRLREENPPEARF